MARLTDLQADTLGRVRDWGDDGLPIDCPYTGRVVAALVRLEMARVAQSGRERRAYLTAEGRAWLHAEAVRQATPEPAPAEPEPSRQLDLLGGAS